MLCTTGMMVILRMVYHLVYHIIEVTHGKLSKDHVDIMGISLAINIYIYMQLYA